MINKSTLIINSKHGPMGGIPVSNYMELTTTSGEVVAQIDEYSGSIYFPIRRAYFQRSYRNQSIDLTVIEITDNYVVVCVHNKYNTIHKLWYRDRTPRVTTDIVVI